MIVYVRIRIVYLYCKNINIVTKKYDTKLNLGTQNDGTFSRSFWLPVVRTHN